MSQSSKTFKNFAEFWSFYLQAHSNRWNRICHLLGTVSVIFWLWLAIKLHTWILLSGYPLSAYGLAWSGHFFIEKNRPATFKYPFWSLCADFKLIYWMLTKACLKLSRAKPRRGENRRKSGTYK